MKPMDIQRLERIIVFIAFACLVLATGCGGGGEPGEETEARPVTIRAHITADPASLSLLGKTDRITEILAVQLSDSLVQYDPKLNLLPRVAESWEFSDDRLTLTLHLRPDVRWHDGRPVTAEDVVFTVSKVREPTVENLNWAPLFKDLVSIEEVNESTVVARYGSASPSHIEAYRLPLIPKHLAEADEDLLTGEFARHPVGCGPFRFVRYAAGQEIVLEANDDYWDGRPEIDRLILKVYPDQRTAYQALLTGDLDIMTVSSALWAKSQDSPEADRLEDFVYSLLSVWLVVWNQDGSNPFFTDPRVRRAMVLALDRESFIASVAHGHARLGTTSYHPDTVWHDSSIRPWPHDPAEAARLLDAAGWRDSDGDGIRDRNGRPFKFTLMINASKQQLNDQIAVWQQQSWAEIGIDAEIEKLEWQAFRERRNAGLFHAASFSLNFTSDPDHFDLYHSSAREGGYNFGGLADPEIDALLEEGRRSFDFETRMGIYHRLQRLIHEREPITCLFYFSSPVLHDRRLQGVVPSPLDYWRTTQGARVWRWAGDQPRD
jgi:peptide/nickel transport system substrate-binding protein